MSIVRNLPESPRPDLPQAHTRAINGGDLLTTCQANAHFLYSIDRPSQEANALPPFPTSQHQAQLAYGLDAKAFFFLF